MNDKNKQKKQETTDFQTNYNDGWCVVSQKKQNDKENSGVANIAKDPIPTSTVANKNVAVVNKVQKSINQSQDIITNEEKNGETQQHSNQVDIKKNTESNNDSNSVASKCDETNNSAQIAPTDKFNQFRERLNEQTKRYYYFDKQFFKIYNCQQINGLDSNQIIKLKDESSQIFQDLRNIMLSYINYNGGIIFFGFNHIKRENFPHMEVNGFDITKNDHKKYEQLQKTLETIVSRITPSKIKYDLSIMKVRKDKNQDRFTQEKYVARIIVQQGQELRTLYVYKEPNSPNEPITAKYSKKDFKFITMKGSGLTQATEQKKQLTKVKDLIYTHIDDFIDPQSSYANIKNSKNKLQADHKKGEDQNDSDNDSNKSQEDDFDEEDYKSNLSDNFYDSQDKQSEHSNIGQTENQEQLTLMKEASKKQQVSNPVPANKENAQSQNYLDVGQWNSELPTYKPQGNEKVKNEESNSNNVYLQSQQQDEEIFPQINSFAQRSSSQIEQTELQYSSSMPQPEILMNNTKLSLEQKTSVNISNNNTNFNNQVINQQTNFQNIQKIVQPKLIGNQNNILPSSSSSQTPEILNQQAILYQQQQQQLILQNMYRQAQVQAQAQSINQVIPNQHQPIQNLINFYKPIDSTMQQQHQQMLNQPSAVIPNPHQYQSYMQYPPSQSSTPIPYQNQPDYINNVANHDSKLNNSLKSLSFTELQDLKKFLEEQVKNYQDYLYLTKIEDQRRKFEVQQNNPLMQNIHALNQNTLNIPYLNANNAPNYSNPHSNTSLSN